MCLIDVSRANQWPPELDLSGLPAKRVWTSPWFLGVWIPMCLGLLWIRSFASRNKIPATEQGHMVWWMVNMFWFHTGCDIFSGLFMTMPVLTELYAHMSPSHHMPRWHDARATLDAGYALELFLEVPLAAWVLFLYWRRDGGRHIAEVFAAAVQLAGTVMYYAPSVAKGEWHCWLSWVDRSCGSVWIIFPLVIMHRHLSAARPDSGKKTSGKKKLF
eukprot:SRR837773.8625.p1 GENE.SRR837773.8625~~SRR837773.8625.p1  ORF type:complete len:254 (-),score=23.12 SRR837773.8625:119-766(-)